MEMEKTEGCCGIRLITDRCVEKGKEFEKR